jgi:hypothetical protein
VAPAAVAVVAGGDDQAAAGAGAPVRGLHRPVAVAVDPGRGGGVHQLGGLRGQALAHSTVRSYQITLRQFCDFITDRRYGWAEECLRRFGQAPAEICYEWNTVEHLAEYEGRPGRRALTYDEVQALFDAADQRAVAIRSRGRKGVLAARRDAVILKTVYAFGLPPAAHGRAAALIHLAAELPAPVLVDLLGISIDTANQWAKHASSDWATYLQSRDHH